MTKKLTLEESKDATKTIIKEGHPQIRSATAITSDVQDSPRLNAIFFLGLFPVLVMGALTYFNDDVRKDFNRTFGIVGSDEPKIELNEQKS